MIVSNTNEWWQWSFSLPSSNPPEGEAGFTGTIIFEDGAEFYFDETASPAIGVSLFAASTGGVGTGAGGVDLFVSISAVERSDAPGPATFDVTVRDADGAVVGELLGGDYVDTIDMLNGIF